MSDPKMIKEIMAAVTIPVMAKARIGHFVECQVRVLLASLERSEVSPPPPCPPSFPASGGAGEERSKRAEADLGCNRSYKQ